MFPSPLTVILLSDQRGLNQHRPTQGHAYPVIISATRLRASARKRTNVRLRVIGLAVVVIVIAGAITYLLIPPVTIDVSGVVSIQSAYQVNFDSLSQFPYSVRIDAAGRYSISIPNQQSYEVFLYLESSSGNSLAALLRCGTIDLYQTTKLGSAYNYNIVPGQCS